MTEYRNICPFRQGVAPTGRGSWKVSNLASRWRYCGAILRYESWTHNPNLQQLTARKHVDNFELTLLQFAVFVFVVVVVIVIVCSGLTSLSTIFQSYHDGVWLRENLSSFSSRVGSNRPGQPQKLGRGLKFRI